MTAKTTKAGAVNEAIASIDNALRILPERMTSDEALPVAKSSNGTPLFECKCPDCGAIRIQDRRKIGKPCMACSNRRRSTHGLSNHKLYRKLKNIQARCNYPSATNYRHYGGRGIKVCDQWANDPVSFVSWALANGYREGLEIDRMDNDGDYSPENCRFVSHAVNSRKRRNAKCNESVASEIREGLDRGEGVKKISESIGAPYMVCWHISKGNTWKPTESSLSP